MRTLVHAARNIGRQALGRSIDPVGDARRLLVPLANSPHPPSHGDLLHIIAHLGVFSELFSPEGSFRADIERLGSLRAEIWKLAGETHRAAKGFWQLSRDAQLGFVHPLKLPLVGIEGYSRSSALVKLLQIREVVTILKAYVDKVAKRLRRGRAESREIALLSEYGGRLFRGASSLEIVELVLLVGHYEPSRRLTLASLGKTNPQVTSAANSTDDLNDVFTPKARMQRWDAVDHM